MKGKELGLNQRDRTLLFFLWKWKVATTASIARAIFAELAIQSAYRRLWALEGAGFIESHADRTACCHLWTLGKLGFETILRDLPELKEEGFRSENLIHDLVTTAMHLGGYLSSIPAGVGLFSEQELRRLPFDFYPPWVPHSERHRADGYWHVPIGKPMATVALEVELSQKKDVRYEAAADFYAGEPQVVRVLWLMSRSSACENLHNKIVTHLRQRPMVHNFISYPVFRSSGWGALIEFGPEQGKPITYLLGKKTSETHQTPDSILILDTRKCPQSSTTWRPLDLGAVRY
jgi:hypothetical protein